MARVSTAIVVGRELGGNKLVGTAEPGRLRDAGALLGWVADEEAAMDPVVVVNGDNRHACVTLLAAENLPPPPAAAPVLRQADSLRCGAAPYGDASECPREVRYHGCLLV